MAIGWCRPKILEGAREQTFMRGDSLSREMNMNLNNNGNKPYSLGSKLAAEFIGVLLFVFIGSLSALKSTLDNLTIHAAFSHGFLIFVLVASFGHISGGHFNPAVTFAVALAGKISPLLLIPYWVAQLLGGFMGALLVKAVTNTSEYESILGGATILSKDDLWYQGLLVEGILTAILTQTILCCAVDTKENMLAPLAIGMTVALDILGVGSITGSMNPARSFGPCAVFALMSGIRDKSIIWTTHYIYWAGPFSGATVSALLYRVFWTRDYGRLMP